MRMTASSSGTLWTCRIQGCGAMIRARWQAPPLIVDARLSPTNLSSCLRTVSDSVARGGNRDGWSARPSQQGDRAASAASDARKGWKLKLVPPGPNDRRGQVESLGRNHLTPDAPYKACSGFTRVTARWIAQPPKAAFVTRLQPSQLPDQTARQLPEQSTTRWVEPSSTGKPRRLGALRIPGFFCNGPCGVNP